MTDPSESPFPAPFGTPGTPPTPTYPPSARYAPEGPPAGSPTIPPGPITKRPSAVGYWVGAVLIIVGAVGAGAWMFSAIFGMFGDTANYPRFSVPGQQTMSLKSGTYKVFVEYTGASNPFGSPIGAGDVEVTGPTGSPIPVDSPDNNENYSWAGNEGHAIGKFVAPVTGSYIVSATGPSGSSRALKIAVGKGLTLGLAGQIAAAMAVGGFTVLIGVVLMIVTVVRRSRWKRSQQSPTYPGYGGPAGYGPTGHGAPPGYGAPGHGAPGTGTAPQPAPTAAPWEAPVAPWTPLPTPPPEAAAPAGWGAPSEPPPPVNPPGWHAAPGAVPPPTPPDR